jgi:hypothetical protein
MSDESVIRFVLRCAGERCPTCNPGDEGAECAGEAMEALDGIVAEVERLREALSEVATGGYTDDGGTWRRYGVGQLKQVARDALDRPRGPRR